MGSCGEAWKKGVRLGGGCSYGTRAGVFPGLAGWPPHWQRPFRSQGQPVVDCGPTARPPVLWL